MKKDEKDISKTAFHFALEKMNSIIVRSRKNHIVIDVMLNLRQTIDF